MLYMCAYTWHPGTTLEEVIRLTAAEPENPGVTVRGYYGLVGGGAGYFLLEADDPQAINDYLIPSMGLIAWDVRQVIERDFAQEVAEAKQHVSQAPST